jgi:hypothetical protein
MTPPDAFSHASSLGDVRFALYWLTSKLRRHAGRVLAASAAIVLASLACHQIGGSPRPAPTPPWPAEHHCWWAAFRTTMPPASVALRIGSALESLGLSNLRMGSLGDTTWAQAGPTKLTATDSPTYAARAVAIRVGDSTRFRTFVAADTIVGARLISMCGDIMSRAALGAIAPRNEEPDDTAPRWRRRL